VAKVLVIDDTAEFCRMTAMVLERAGHQTVMAFNGPDGLNVAAAEKPDLIILDYMMPGMTGWDVFRLLQEQDIAVRTPVIMITAYSKAYEEERQQALEMGFADFLTKPVSPSALAERVNELLYIHRRSGPALLEDL
jgi:DNA-binding response OmpR family regulator